MIHIQLKYTAPYATYFDTLFFLVIAPIHYHGICLQASKNARQKDAMMNHEMSEFPVNLNLYFYFSGIANRIILITRSYIHGTCVTHYNKFYVQFYHASPHWLYIDIYIL